MYTLLGKMSVFSFDANSKLSFSVSFAALLWSLKVRESVNVLEINVYLYSLYLLIQNGVSFFLFFVAVSKRTKDGTNVFCVKMKCLSLPLIIVVKLQWSLPFLSRPHYAVEGKERR